MTVAEAYELVKNDNKNLLLIKCFELDYCFAFWFIPPEFVGEHFSSCYTAVFKESGKVGYLQTCDDFDGFRKAKEIDISQFEQP